MTKSKLEKFYIAFEYSSTMKDIRINLKERTIHD